MGPTRLGGPRMTENTDSQGPKQEAEAALDQYEISTRKRKLPLSLVSASGSPSSLTIRSLAAPRKTPLSTGTTSTSGNSQHQSQPLVTARTAAAVGQLEAMGQLSTEGNLPGRGMPAAAPLATKPSALRRLPGSLAQPQPTGVDTASCHASSLQCMQRAPSCYSCNRPHPLTVMRQIHRHSSSSGRRCSNRAGGGGHARCC